MNAGGVRRTARYLEQRAAQEGLAQAHRLGEFTPREIASLFHAEAARRRQRAQQADFTAFLIGRYVALAIHAPRRYPRRPNAVREVGRQMPPEEMKRLFMDMAARREMGHGDC